MKTIQVLRGKDKGATGYIVGKGPSVLSLKADAFGNGPIITLNEAMVAVEELGLENTIYAMQKDGCLEHLHGRNKGFQCLCDCPHDRTPQINGGRPKKAPLLLHLRESVHCFPDYSEKYLFDTGDDFGIRWDTPSIVCAIECLKLLGVSHIKLLCCDSYFGEILTAHTGTGEWSLELQQPAIDSSQPGYPRITKMAIEHLKGIAHEWVRI